MILRDDRLGRRILLSMDVTRVTLGGVESHSPELTLALRALERAIVPPRAGDSLGNWRWSVRQRLGGLRTALNAADVPLGTRERGVLMGRLTTLATEVLERTDVDAVRAELRRLLSDVSRQTAGV